MRPKMFALALALGLAPAAAQAAGYGVYSGAGYNPSFVLVMLQPEPFAPTVDWRNPAPLGTAANPVPVYGVSTVFQVGRTLIYNKPPSPDDRYRIVPHR
jgi:hypothetical protein